MSNFVTEFPDYDPATMPPIPTGWTDQSWHNDTCPHFVTADSLWLVWIDYADITLREIQEPSPRFNVQVNPEVFDFNASVFESDDWLAILAFVQSPQEHLPQWARDMLATMPEPMPDSLRMYPAPQSLESARAWMLALIACGRVFHFEDDAATVWNGATGKKLFNPCDATWINEARKALYAMPRETWGEHECPIGYCMYLEGTTRD